VHPGGRGGAAPLMLTLSFPVSNEYMRCIYCLKEKPSFNFKKREHVIPQCFGRFKPDNFVLRGIVCDECNSYFGDNIELFLGRDSFESIERLKHGIKPKEKLKNRRRIKSKIISGLLKGAIVAEREFGESGKPLVERVPQAGFFNKEKNEYVYYELGKIPTASELNQQGYDIKDHAIHRIGYEKEFEELEKELKSKGINFQSETEFVEGPIPGDSIEVEVEITLDRVIQRGICKIAFNYLSYITDSSFALSDNFNGIRGFIRYNEGKVDDFIAVNQPPILREEQLLSNFGVRFTEGHLITLGWNRNMIVSKVSPFNAQTYGVRLCGNFSGIWRPLDTGHHFDIKTKEVNKLVAANRLLLP